jgi:hypothetical protein
MYAYESNVRIAWTYPTTFVMTMRAHASFPLNTESYAER